MPEFLEKKLKKKYGKHSDIPFKIMNKKGFMRGSKITEKGKAAEKKHESDYKPSAKLMGLGGEKKRESHKKHKGSSFMEALK